MSPAPGYALRPYDLEVARARRGRLRRRLAWFVVGVVLGWVLRGWVYA